MQLNETAASTLVINVSVYAKQHATTEQQIIKRITLGQLSGYQAQGIWYVRLAIDPITPSSPALPISVAEYSKQTGIPIPKILEEIANGTKQGFPKHGIWYIGTAPDSIAIQPRKLRIDWLIYSLLFLAIVVLMLWTFWDQHIEKTTPKLTALTVEVKIKDLIGILRPVANEKVYLMSMDLEDIANNYLKLFQDESNRYQSSQLVNKTTPPKWISMLIGSTALSSLLFDVSLKSNTVNVWEFRQNFEKSKPLWADYLVQQAITDTTGQAQFLLLPQQEYWVVSWTETPTGMSFWKHWVNLIQEKNQLSLVPGNAIYFK